MNKEIKANMLRNGLILALFAIVTTGLIALTFFGTKDKIAFQQQQKLQTILDAVLDKTSYDNDILFDCALVHDINVTDEEINEAITNNSLKIYRATKDNTPVAIAIESIAPDGYNGKISLVVGMQKTTDAEQTQQVLVSGVRVLAHKETPGLGDKIELRISDWILDFDGKLFNKENAPMWSVKKDGGQFDQFTGATITPRAVVKTVKQSIEYYMAHHQQIFAAKNACALDSPAENSTRKGANHD